jgi:hypothetical protein
VYALLSVGQAVDPAIDQFLVTALTSRSAASLMSRFQKRTRTDAVFQFGRE